jgi:excisionase family DNA binding protein
MPFDGSLSERLPTPEEVEKAKQATAAIAKTAKRDGGLSLRLKNGSGEVVVDLPPAVSKMVLDLLMLISRGEAVTLLPFGAELTTQQAADILNVSRPFLVKLIEKKDIPCHRVGRHRRISAEHLFKYKKHRDAARREALDKLAQLGEEIDAE